MSSVALNVCTVNACGPKALPSDFSKLACAEVVAACCQSEESEGKSLDKLKCHLKALIQDK